MAVNKDKDVKGTKIEIYSVEAIKNPVQGWVIVTHFSRVKPDITVQNGHFNCLILYNTIFSFIYLFFFNINFHSKRSYKTNTILLTVFQQSLQQTTKTTSKRTSG